ncbi:GAF domain-containing protein [Modestobacter sp. SYSU DS0511]
MGAGTVARERTAQELLVALVEVSADGLGVLDPEGRLVRVNRAGRVILGLADGDLPPGFVPFGTSAAGLGVPDGSGALQEVTTADGRRRTLEYRLTTLPDGHAAVWFSDVTDELRQQDRLTAITRAAARVAGVRSLRTTLDAVAQEVVRTAQLGAVQIFALDDPRAEVRVLGMAGFGDAADFTERLSAVRRLGAHVRFMDAFATGRPVVVRHRKPVIMADPRWAPLHAVMDTPEWDSFASVPLVVGGRTVGVMNAYYKPGEDPSASSLAFLEAMADQAAVAIHIAALLAHTRSEAESDERRRLARDLHDSVVQQLFSMRLQAGALRAQLDAGDAGPAGVRAAAGELAELAQSALADLRGLVFELRPLELADRGLVEAVRAHADSVEVRTGLVIEVLAEGDVEPAWELTVQEDVYRVVQEALHNVVKHAQASTVEVRFAIDPVEHCLVVTVLDDGRGAVEAPAGPTLGLVSMRERAERWGGRCTAGPRDGGGWQVRLTLPLVEQGRERTQGGLDR